MKKSIILAAIALGVFVTSCRKERVCECKTTTTEVRSGFGAGTTVETSSEKTTKAKQMKGPFKYQTDCFSSTYGYNNSGGNGATAWSSVVTEETICELK